MFAGHAGPEATVSRLAGDKFTVLALFQHLSKVKNLVNSIRQGCQDPVFTKESRDFLTNQHWRQFIPENSSVSKGLLPQENRAMYQANKKKE